MGSALRFPVILMLIEIQCLLDYHRQLERFTSAYHTACREIITRRASAFQTRREHARASCAKRSAPILASVVGFS